MNIGVIVFYNKQLDYGFIRDIDSNLQVYFKGHRCGWIVGTKVSYALYESTKGNKLEAKSVYTWSYLR